MAASDLRSVAFPVLSDTQIAALASCSTASLKRYPDGHVLVKVGDPHFKFFVVKSGSIFSFIGAVPRTEWLPPEIEKDDKGFVRTEGDVGRHRPGTTIPGSTFRSADSALTP